MADNYLEKQYADYQARKSAMPAGTQRKSRTAMWQVAELVVPSVDDARMCEFYAELFCGTKVAEDAVEFDNGMRLRFQSAIGAPLQFTVRMASHYQYEQLLRRLDCKCISVEDGVVVDPSGNKMYIKF
ncbi:MAG: hypothetical protein J6U89_09925 [Bacteroidaceae bacterium]|nr:hypothetical protein [Bacteroidaceae bacterium]